MNTIDPVNQSLYFAAAQTAASQTAAEINKKKKTDGKRSSFFSSLNKAKIKGEFSATGLPQELADLTEEEVVVFLKDAVDLAGDELEETLSPISFAKYRTALSQFINYIEKNNFEIIKHKRLGFNRKGKPRDPAVQVQIINQKLDQLASDLLYNHMDKLKLLSKVDEMNGLIIDLLAS